MVSSELNSQGLRNLIETCNKYTNNRTCIREVLINIYQLLTHIRWRHLQTDQGRSSYDPNHHHFIKVSFKYYILGDRRMNVKIKGKVYRTVVRPALMYGAETWALKKAQEKKLEVAEMRMLRWMCGVTKLDKIRNERIRGTTKVGEITKIVQERRFKWYGHVLRREEHYVGRRAMVMKVPGERKRGRHKRRWLDKEKDDIKEKGLSADDVYDRATWRRMSLYIDPT